MGKEHHGKYREKNRARLAEKERERRARRRAEGLCIDCGKPAVPGKVRCAEDLARRLEYIRKRRGKTE